MTMTMDNWQTLVTAMFWVGVLVTSPFVAFFVVKFGTFGFYVGRHQFYSFIKDKEQR